MQQTLNLLTCPCSKPQLLRFSTHLLLYSWDLACHVILDIRFGPNRWFLFQRLFRQVQRGRGRGLDEVVGLGGEDPRRKDRTFAQQRRNQSDGNFEDNLPIFIVGFWKPGELSVILSYKAELISRPSTKSKVHPPIFRITAYAIFLSKNNMLPNGAWKMVSPVGIRTHDLLVVSLLPYH